MEASKMRQIATRVARLVGAGVIGAGLIGVGAAAQAADAGPANGALGTWLDQTGKAAITIKSCGAKLCGTITWLRAPLDAQGKPKTDIHNTNSALTKRPICGLQILGNFVPDDANAWTGGFIYDPEKGETYDSNMHLKPDGTLAVRGYVGISLLGRSEIWTRPAQALAHC